MQQHLNYDNSSYVLGRGSIEYLMNIKDSKIALVADLNVLKKNNFFEKIEGLLSQNNNSCEVIADVQREPQMSDLKEPISKINEFKPNCILAVGGGSVIDTAKIIWVFYEHPNLTWEQAFTPFAIPPLGKKANLITVPTTSGTGSETTCVAVVVDYESKKQLLMSRELIPDTAILDYDLVETMPPKVAAFSGLDALAHAMEAAVCIISSPLVTSTANAAVLDILQWLPLSVNAEPGSTDFSIAREAMHTAASMAGMAINNSCAGLTHAMDQPGPAFGLPHGLVCGILLPYTVRFVGAHTEYVKLALRLGFSGSEDELFRQFVEKLIEFNESINIPKSFKECGISETDFKNKLDDLVDSAIVSGAYKFAPKKPDKEQIKAMFMQAYYGDALE